MLSSGSVTEIEISGYARGQDPGYDAINVSGNATINSGAQFTVLRQGFTAIVGDSFRVINAGGTLSLPGGAGSLVIVPPSGGEPYTAGVQGRDFFLQRGTTFTGVNVWNTDSGGNWNTAGNWSLGLPVAGQVVIIDRGTANPTITVSDAGRVAGQLQNAETLTISAGSLTLDGNSTSSGVINISGGTLTANAPLTATTINLSSSGALGGHGDGDLDGAGTWTGNATMGGSGHTVLQSGASLAVSDAALKFVNGGRVIDNAGTFTMAGGHTLRVDAGGATFNNTGSFTFLDDATFAVNGGNLVFNNAALVRKTGGTGASLIPDLATRRT